MSAGAFIVGMMAVLFLAAVTVLVLRWLDKHDTPYPHEIGDGED